MKYPQFLVIVQEQDVRKCIVNAWQKDNCVLFFAIAIIVTIEK